MKLKYSADLSEQQDTLGDERRNRLYSKQEQTKILCSEGVKDSYTCTHDNLL